LKFFLLLLVASLAFAQSRQLAITIDDLPRGGDKSGTRDLADTTAMTAKLTAALRGIPVTVFVNPGQARQLGDAGLAALLELWRKQGAEIGNHTFSHPDLNKIPLAEYQADILRSEPAIRTARGGSQSRYFRHPFLHTGPTEETKRGLADFLKEHNYLPAPVTIDTADWMFASVYLSSPEPDHVRDEYIRYMDSHASFFENRTLEVVGRPIPQILLKPVAFASKFIPAIGKSVPSLTADRAREIWPNRWVIDPEPFHQATGWRGQATLEDTLARTLAWFQREKLV
jgi:peptidoglycan/xylan/chitin deacetylase (PgdA/CDA1 family)